MICFGCGSHFKSQREGSAIKVYDETSEKWIEECPFCECEDFYFEGDEYLFYTS